MCAPGSGKYSLVVSCIICCAALAGLLAPVTPQLPSFSPLFDHVAFAAHLSTLSVAPYRWKASQEAVDEIVSLRTYVAGLATADMIASTNLHLLTSLGWNSEYMSFQDLHVFLESYGTFMRLETNSTRVYPLTRRGGFRA